jgi:ABC-type branched-subunit amino acid transport system substrate-binding protein
MLDDLDLADAEFNGLFSEVVDADDKNRTAVGLKLARSRLHQDQRAFLTRNESRLPVAHH